LAGGLALVDEVWFVCALLEKYTNTTYFLGKESYKIFYFNNFSDVCNK